MVNLILSFIENKKNKDNKPIAFYEKKVCFVTNDSKILPKAGETWECFLWVEKDKFNLVRPFRKIEPDKIEEEKSKVASFNEELQRLEAIAKKEPDFEKVVFDKETNKPYLFSTVPLPKLKERYDDYIIIKKEDGKWLRPIMNSDDRKYYQRNCI